MKPTRRLHTRTRPTAGWPPRWPPPPLSNGCGRWSCRPARLPVELVAKVLTGLRYKPGWSFEPAVLPDGTVAVRAVADLEDHLHPGRTFRTSRAAPLRVAAGQTPGDVVVEAALRAVLSIEEHEIREQLVLDGKRSQPLDPHALPNPTNTTPRT